MVMGTSLGPAHGLCLLDNAKAQVSFVGEVRWALIRGIDAETPLLHRYNTYLTHLGKLFPFHR
jgi:hypothetical protein